MFRNYGGRGIKVCDEWRRPGGFSNFIRDMGLRPSPKHSIERKDNDGDYCKENCRWATDAEQMRNTRRTHFIEFNGQRLCITDWAIATGIPAPVITGRMNKFGWSIEKALTTPVKHRVYRRFLTYRGETMSVAEWGRRLGLKRGTIKERLRNGWSIADALSIPA